MAQVRPESPLPSLEPELFLVPLQGTRGLVYSPMTRRACRVNLTRPLEPQVAAARLTGLDVPVYSPFPRRSAEFLPSRVTLFPTNRCASACRYCYARGGQLPPLDMPLATALAAVRHVVRSAEKKGDDHCVLALHGGGEPLLRLDWLQQVMAAARETSAQLGLKLLALSSTGGLIPHAGVPWLARNFTSLAVSFEVLPEVQNAQRPAAGGGASWPHVHRLLKLLDAEGLPYTIRTTVTSANVQRLVETAEAVAAQYASKAWHVVPMMLDEPLAGEVRGLFADLDAFVKHFLEAHRRCRALGIALQYSGALLEAYGSTFHCGVANDNFAVTPDGVVTACMDVLSAAHPRARQYAYGRIADNGSVEIDEAKRAAIQRLDVRNMPWCQGCFLKYHCAGDCVVRLGDHPLGDRDNPYCRVNRAIAAVLLDRALDGDPQDALSPALAPCIMRPGR